MFYVCMFYVRTHPLSTQCSGSSRPLHARHARCPGASFGLRVFLVFAPLQLQHTSCSTLWPRRRPPRPRSTAILGCRRRHRHSSRLPPASFSNSSQTRPSSAPLRPQFQLTSRNTLSDFYLAYTSCKLDLHTPTPTPTLLVDLSKNPRRFPPLPALATHPHDVYTFTIHPARRSTVLSSLLPPPTRYLHSQHPPCSSLTPFLARTHSPARDLVSSARNTNISYHTYLYASLDSLKSLQNPNPEHPIQLFYPHQNTTFKCPITNTVHIWAQREDPSSPWTTIHSSSPHPPFPLLRLSTIAHHQSPSILPTYKTHILPIPPSLLSTHHPFTRILPPPVHLPSHTMPKPPNPSIPNPLPLVLHMSSQSTNPFLNPHHPSSPHPPF
jgi:hypothetical protein